MGFFDRLKAGLSKTREKFIDKIDELLHSSKKIDDDLIDELMTYYETNGIAYGQRKPGEFDPTAAMVAFGLAIFLGVMIRSMLIGSMSNIHRAKLATDYLKKNSVKFLESRDTFLFMNVQRKPRGGGGGSRSGGSSGHSSGHGGGGGSF